MVKFKKINYTSIVILFGLLSLNTNPKLRAAETRASSSGD